MRRVISIAMVVFGSITLLTAVWEFLPPFKSRFYYPHATSACIFGILVLIHVWLNRKPILRHFRKLGWWWIPVGLGAISIVWVGIGLPIIMSSR